MVGYAASAVIIFAVPVLLISGEHRSQSFWPRVAWTEFLAFLVWGYFAWFFRVATKQSLVREGTSGIAPAIGVLVAAYALVSFVLMSLHALLPSVDFLNRFHLAAQIVVVAVFIIVAATLQIARISQIERRDDSMPKEGLNTDTTPK
jgi:hypothetical protein